MSNSRYRCMLVRIACLAMVAAAVTPVRAMIVYRIDPSNPAAPVNTTAPADDPGWSNVSASGFSYLYLGNQWMMTAGHVTEGTVNLAQGSFSLIPNTAVRLTNPSGTYSKRNSQGNQVSGTLSTFSDIKLFRVNTDTTTGLRPEDLNPNIKPISIASSSPGVGTSIVMIGVGNERVVNLNDTTGTGQFHINVNTSGSNWTWATPTLNSGGNFHGFATSTNRRKVWGANQVSTDQSVEGFSDGDNVVVTNAGGGIETLTLVAQFNNPNNPQNVGITNNEAIATAGDSGGPVFFKDGQGQWQLAGIMNSIYQLNGQQPTYTGYGVYGTYSGGEVGDWTAFSDLANSHYSQQIATLRAQSNYSVMGDINLDGVVSGDGTGAWANDDVTAFIQGWLHTQSQGNILSWKKGDLDQNGTTDLNDFALLRTALGGSIGNGQIEAFFASGAGTTVPEPQSWVIILGLISGLMWLLRPRRRLVPVPVRPRS